MRMVETTIGEIEDVEDTLVFQQFVMELQSIVKTLVTNKTVEADLKKIENAAMEKLKQEYEQLQQAQAEERRLLEEKIGALGAKLSH